MCGIVGIINRDRTAPCLKDNVVSMRDLQVHRGPDGAGVYVNQNVGLGHRRLSIIDLSGGHQPMANEDRSMWIVFNGEIYNYKSIRNDLVKKGHIFRTESDTETILHLYEDMAENCVSELNGMFAFAIWNDKDKSLFMARDRIGIKPLYFSLTKNAFLFSSEIKSLLANGMVNKAINERVLPEYFIFRDISGEETLFEGIKTLRPGHTLIYKEDKVQIKQYWSLFPDRQQTEFEKDEALEELESLLLDSVRIRLMSDVPLGTFCSGGIDSSLITAMAAGFAGENIDTFSVGFHENDYDETHYAQMVSKQYNTRHHEIKLSNSEFADLLPRMIWQNDMPLNFANSIQMYAISRRAKKYVTVVLTGEGSDELFAGYPRYHIPKLVLKYRRAPKIVQNIFNLSSLFLPSHRLKKIQRNVHQSYEDLIIYNSSYLRKDFIMDILTTSHPFGINQREELVAKCSNMELDYQTILLLQDQHNYLLSILMRQDKMSMAASIESRVPFLDHRIIEFANKLPTRYKNHGLSTKKI